LQERQTTLSTEKHVKQGIKCNCGGLIYFIQIRRGHLDRKDRDYTPDVVEHVRYTLEQYKRGGLLSNYMVRQCMPKPECRTALLYFLTKTHKSPMTLRTIVCNMVAFLDHRVSQLT